MVGDAAAPMVEVLLQDNEFPQPRGHGPTNIADAVDFLIRTPLINGEVIRLDGGARPPARTKWASGQ